MKFLFLCFAFLTAGLNSASATELHMRNEQSLRELESTTDLIDQDRYVRFVFKRRDVSTTQAWGRTAGLPRELVAAEFTTFDIDTLEELKSWGRPKRSILVKERFRPCERRKQAPSFIFIELKEGSTRRFFESDGCFISDQVDGIARRLNAPSSRWLFQLMGSVYK